jgi:hypothetical protein
MADLAHDWKVWSRRVQLVVGFVGLLGLEHDHLKLVHSRHGRCSLRTRWR